MKQFVAVALFTLALQNLSATVLIFEPATNFANLSPDYGDRVTTATQGSFRYGLAGGATPNVVVDYTAMPKLWTTDYGDLKNSSTPAAARTWTFCCAPIRGMRSN